MKIQLLQIRQVGVCCYLLWDENTLECAVIDPGADAPSIRAAMERSGLILRHIFLTHLHYDHVGAVDELRGEGVTVWVCPAELNNDLAIMRNKMDVTLPLSFYDEGDVIRLGGLSIDVMRTPGHTPGSVCLRCEDVLFTGDTLFAGTCGRVDFPGGSPSQMLQSLRRLAALETDYTVLSGHTGPTTISRERETNPFVLEATAQ